MPSPPESITTIINYNIDTGKRQTVSLNPNINGDGTIDSNVPVTTVVRNARLRNPPPTLETVGYTLTRQKTSLTKAQFLDDDLVKKVYYEEMSALICGVTGATICRPFHHMVRSADKTQVDNVKRQGPAGAAHCDYSKNGGVDMYDAFCPKEQLKKGKFYVINAWRNIDPEKTIQDDHLAMCDSNSITAPDDFIPLDLITREGTRSETYRLEASRAHLHRWNYFPEMRSDEVLLFMQYNSDPTSPSRFTFHSSISDPTANDKTPFRESVELRTICFLPDFPINTIPKVIANGTSMVDRGLKKMIELVTYLPKWDDNGRAWVRSIAYSEENFAVGIEKLARLLAKDHVRDKMRENADGTGEGMRDETFEAIIKKTLEDGEFQRIFQIHVKPYSDADRVQSAITNLTNGVAPTVIQEHWQDKSWAVNLIKTFGLDSGSRQIAQALVKFSCENGQNGLNSRTTAQMNNAVVDGLANSATFKENCRLSFSS